MVYISYWQNFVYSPNNYSFHEVFGEFWAQQAFSRLDAAAALIEHTSIVSQYGILGPGRQAVEIKLMLCLCPARAAHYHCPVGKERDSCWPKGSWSDEWSYRLSRRLGAERIWYNHRHWSLEQGQATVKIKQRTPETTVETLATFTLTMKGCGGRVFKQ